MQFKSWVWESGFHLQPPTANCGEYARCRASNPHSLQKAKGVLVYSKGDKDVKI
jgi:hypothetical protein